jgi:Arm DNA-binding domain
MPKTLSDMTIRTLPQGIFWDTKLPGFGVRVGKRTITFIVNTGTTRIKIGTYPSLSLAEARRRVFTLKADPDTVSANTTLTEALTLYFYTHCTHYRPKVLKETKRYLAKYPEIKLSKLSTQEVYKVLDAQTRAEANKLFSVSRTFFRFCVQRRLIQRSPLEGLHVPNKEVARSRVLTDDELRAIHSTCINDGSALREKLLLLLQTNKAILRLE